MPTPRLARQRGGPLSSLPAAPIMARRPIPGPRNPPPPPPVGAGGGANGNNKCVARCDREEQWRRRFWRHQFDRGPFVRAGAKGGGRPVVFTCKGLATRQIPL